MRIRLIAQQRTATVVAESRLRVEVEGRLIAEIEGSEWRVLDRTPQSARLGMGGAVVRVEAGPEGVTVKAAGACGERVWSRGWT